MAIVGSQRRKKGATRAMIAHPEEWGHHGDNGDIASCSVWGPKSAHQWLKWLIKVPYSLYSDPIRGLNSHGD